MRGREYPNQLGGLARALEVVGERWTLLIVRDAMGGVSRFEDFHARLGLSRKTLSVRLGLLVEHGVMTRAPYQQRPVRYDYRLTPKGAALTPALRALADWGETSGTAGTPRSLNPKSHPTLEALVPDAVAQAATDLVLCERQDGVLILTLNRPDRLNAWNDALEAVYFAQLDAAEDDPKVKAIVVTGAGRGFCAGADMEDLSAAGDTDVEALLRNRPRPRSFPLTVRKPMIAAINGAAAGLGLVEALYCDVRFATPQAKLTTAFARRGLIAEYGLSWLLPRLIGHAAALDLLLSGRIIRGEEAHRLGLVNFLSEPDQLVADAVAYAQDLADHCAPSSMATIKAQVTADHDRDFAAAVAAADDLMIASLQGPDISEGVRSHMEQRAPAFTPLPARS